MHPLLTHSRDGILIRIPEQVRWIHVLRMLQRLLLDRSCALEGEIGERLGVWASEVSSRTARLRRRVKRNDLRSRYLQGPKEQPRSRRLDLPQH